MSDKNGNSTVQSTEPEIINAVYFSGTSTILDIEHLNEVDVHIKQLRQQHRQAQLAYISSMDHMTRAEAKSCQQVLAKKQIMIERQQNLEFAIQDRKMITRQTIG